MSEQDKKQAIKQIKSLITSNEFVKAFAALKYVADPEDDFIMSTDIKYGFKELFYEYELPKDINIEGLDDKGLLELFLHELFHVYSRHNIDKREEMYAVIGYEKCEDLVFPDILKEVTIANPDAPDNKKKGWADW